MKIPPPSALRRDGFTLVELLVSTALIAVLMGFLLTTVDQSQKIFTRTSVKASQFQASRAAFETMTRKLSQATLNTYWQAYDSASANTTADLTFRRESDLQMLSGHLSDAQGSAGRIPGIFTGPPIANLESKPTVAYPTHGIFFFSPLGTTEQSTLQRLNGMLSGCGYFIEYGDDPARPAFLPNTANNARKRFRLMELSVPSEQLTIYSRPLSGNDFAGIPWKYSTKPQILNRDKSVYIARTNATNATNAAWVRPLWMESALTRISTSGAAANTAKYRFKYSRVLAENIIALVVLPKLAEKDRLPDPTRLDGLAPEYQYDTWRILKQDTGAALANAARDNLLPPIVQIVMVAIDEASALRLREDQLNWTTRAGKQLFTQVKTEADLVADLDQLESRLRADNVNFRVFTTDVVIRASKWSKDPK